VEAADPRRVAKVLAIRPRRAEEVAGQVQESA
jgi:hypothetical protein